MKAKLLKKLRREIKLNLYIARNDSQFTLNYLRLTTELNGKEYKSSERYGKITNELISKLFIELEHLALSGYIKDKRICK